MRSWVLDYLVCPACQGELTCDGQVVADDDVETGRIICQQCAAAYPIVRGIPRMVPGGALEDEKQRTAEAFGWQWQEFDDFHRDPAMYDAQFLDWVAPLQPPFFSGKVVLDAGCGMGRFTAAVAHLGAERVMGIDLSESVESARRFTRGLPNVAIVQADIYRLPFRAAFDFAFSIGVIHHLPDPESGIRSVAQHVRPGGRLSVWVYGYENNGWIRNVVNPIRERITAKLPRRALYALSLLLAVLLQPVLRLLYSGPPGMGAARFLPYYAYLHWLSQFGLRHNHVVIFDHLVAPTAVYVRREELQDWFTRAGLDDVQLSWRNENSWRAHGRQPMIEVLQPSA